MPLLETKGAGSAQGFGLSLGSEEPNYIEDVFSTYLYASTSGTDNQVINGIDLSTKSGLVWSKSRTRASSNHYWIDTVRGSSSGNTNALVSNTTAAQSSGANLDYLVFNSNGYTAKAVVGGGELGTNTYYGDLVSWTFRKQKKFFDIVTYTGDGVAGRTIAHNLGSVPGFMVVKSTSQTSTWAVYHRSIDVSQYVLALNTADAQFGASYWNYTAPTSSVFTVSGGGDTNQSGQTYVAYLFAHDAGGFGLAGTDNVISCGSYTGNATAGNAVTLGYEPQWIMIKQASGSDAGTNSWSIYDNMRGMPNGSSNDNRLEANNSSAEVGYPEIAPTATGFVCEATGGRLNASGGTYIYIAIRRPNKPPESGTEVYNAIARTGTGAAATVTGVGFAPDHTIIQGRPGGYAPRWGDRLRGNRAVLRSSLTNAELTAEDDLSSFDMDGISLTGTGASLSNANTVTYINHFFRRAPGFMDVVCDTGTGAAHTVAHNLTAVPELMIRKKRSATDNWIVYAGDATDYLILNTTAATADLDTMWNDTAPTASVFTVGTNDDVNQSTGTFVTYLFATLPGISKVGTYTGTAAAQVINCGFTAGARFILIKRTDSTGDWLVADSARGIVAGNDPLLYLNSTAAEITTLDWIDADSSGFIVNQEATANANVSSATYIYFAVA